MRQTELFTKTTKNIPSDEKSVNARLLIKGGFIDKTMAGVYTYLPLGWKVIYKISNIIREEMDAMGAQEILMPALAPKENWKQTGRWEGFDVLFKLEGAGGSKYALGATHEEIITPLAKKFIESYKDLPFAAYQIQTKFRNEPRAKSGVLRGREFIMKDLYSFHINEDDLESYYKKVDVAYKKIYKRLELGEKTYFTFATGGAFSKYSHEYQTITANGEDIIFICEECNVGLNKELVKKDADKKCPLCGNKKLKQEKAIEVGNIFKLKTKFSEAFDLTYKDKNGKDNPVIMGCYGIGISRLLGALVEIFNDERGIIWPEEVAPFKVHLLSLGNDKKVIKAADKLYKDLEKAGVEVLYDDREESAGAKFADADLIGLPIRLVVSEKTLAKDSVEVKKRSEKDIKLIKMNKVATFIK